MKLRSLLDFIAQVAQKHHIEEPYLVGGIPRDKMLGTLSKMEDVDIGNGHASIKNLAKEVEIALSKQFSIDVKTMDDGHTSLFLKNSPTDNKAGGFKIDFSSNFILPNIDQELNKLGIKNIDNITREAFSRDFYCNTLMLSLDFKRIKDPTNQGITDIKNKILRTCLDPDITLRVNPNRIPRVIYLSAKLGFSVDPKIINWIKTHKELISNISPGYLSKTLNKALQHNKDRVIQLLDEMELWKVLPITETLYPAYAQRFLKTAQLRKNYDYGESLYFGNMDRFKSVKDFLKKRKKKQKKRIKQIKNMSKNAYFEEVEDGFDERVWLEDDFIINDEDPVRMDKRDNKNINGEFIWDNWDEELEKIKENEPEEEKILQPAPFYEEIYSGAHGVNGLYSSPLEYYDGSIVDDGITTNPWSHLYQMAELSINELYKLSKDFANKLA